MIMLRRICAIATACVIAALTGCVQIPQRVTGTTDPRPSMTGATATKLVKRYIALDNAAWEKLDPSRLSETATGPELARQGHLMTIQKRIGGKDRPPHLPTDARYTVTSTPGGHYPALAVISGFAEAEDAPDSFYLAERASAADPWLISYSAGEDLNTFLPAVDKRERMFKPVGAKTKINGVTAGRITDLLTDALRQPTAKVSKRFVANDSFNDAKAVPLDKKESAHQKRTFDYISVPWQQAYRTGKGDLIVFGAFTRTTRYDYLDDYYTYFKSGYEKKLLPGKYSSLTYTSYCRYALRVPKKGKFAVQHMVWSLDDLTGSDYTSY
ncbi:hypothetical protein [Microlunatus soli]|uniref:DUF8094 domain-containing protein n=1 Tax=Microlunatus soli TaxID=630515 RepID=A0A1H1R880_9ACTN|nr:hypothetical protein [Microlunatus soli]SDS31987.1 hypothetical protein SAMN04489812_1551 [Microlunatus soli]